jgi:hypothetical protein
VEACEPDPIDASFYHVSKENLLTLAARMRSYADASHDHKARSHKVTPQFPHLNISPLALCIWAQNVVRTLEINYESKNINFVQPSFLFYYFLFTLDKKNRVSSHHAVSTPTSRNQFVPCARRVRSILKSAAKGECFSRVRTCFIF